MAQLFNTKDSNTYQSSQNVPPTPPVPPAATPPFQGQMFHRKQRFPMRTRVVGVIMILVVVIGLPGIIVLSRQQQNFQGSAHTPEPSVTASCQSSGVHLSSSYSMSDVPKNVTCQIQVSDSQNYLNDSFSYKLNDPNYSKDVDTNQSTMSPGVVTYSTKCSDGFTKTNQAGYSWTKPCLSPTPTQPRYKSPTPTQKYYKTPTPTPSKKVTPTPTIKMTVTPTLKPNITPTITPTTKLTPTGTPALTPTPTVCVTPGQVTNVKVTCANCAVK